MDRHYGLFANGQRRENLLTARRLLDVPVHDDTPEHETDDEGTEPTEKLCPACGALMVLSDFFGPPPRHRGGDPP